MLLEDKSTAAEPIQHQIERIVHSEQFRSSEVLRRLLTFLSEKAIAGEADNLKEYVVAIDGLGKSSTYDPQHNSAVRIQMGRLRQRLAEYYRTEGKNDPMIVDLPKGRFRLTFQQRSEADISGHELTPPATVSAPSIQVLPPTAEESTKPSILRLAAGLLIVAMLVGLGYLLGRTIPRQQSATDRNAQDLAALWEPFLNHKLPLILSIEDPLFAEIRSSPGVYFRDRSMNEWSDVVKSAALHKLTGALDQSEMHPSRYYTAFGEAEASFLLGGLLKTPERALSIVRTSQLSWQQLADNNVIFVGVQNLF